METEIIIIMMLEEKLGCWNKIKIFIHVFTLIVVEKCTNFNK